ncbi:unnamed protein product, partial [Ectocarpus sp. 13 AM-2016]
CPRRKNRPILRDNAGRRRFLGTLCYGAEKRRPAALRRRNTQKHNRDTQSTLNLGGACCPLRGPRRGRRISPESPKSRYDRLRPNHSATRGYLASRTLPSQQIGHSPRTCAFGASDDPPFATQRTTAPAAAFLGWRSFPSTRSRRSVPRLRRSTRLKRDIC